MMGQGRERGFRRPSRRDCYEQCGNSEPARPMTTGGYKVDVSRGERNGRVSSEWFNRPDDERYLSLDDWAVGEGPVRAQPDPGGARPRISVWRRRNNPDRLRLCCQAHAPVAPTHWAFGQLASIVGAPAAYLRQLPAPLAGNQSAIRSDQPPGRAGQNPRNRRRRPRRTSRSDRPRLWPDLRSRTGRGRAEIAGNGTGDTRWKVPGVLDWSTGVYNPYVDISK